MSLFLKNWSETHVLVAPISKTKFNSCSGFPIFTGATNIPLLTLNLTDIYPTISSGSSSFTPVIQNSNLQQWALM